MLDFVSREIFLFHVKFFVFNGVVKNYAKIKIELFCATKTVPNFQNYGKLTRF